MIIIAHPDTTKEQDDELIAKLLYMNPNRLYCFVYVFGGLVLFDLDRESDLAEHNAFYGVGTKDFKKSMVYYHDGELLK